MLVRIAALFVESCALPQTIISWVLPSKINPPSVRLPMFMLLEFSATEPTPALDSVPFIAIVAAEPDQCASWITLPTAPEFKFVF